MWRHQPVRLVPLARLGRFRQMVPMGESSRGATDQWEKYSTTVNCYREAMGKASKLVGLRSMASSPCTAAPAHASLPTPSDRRASVRPAREEVTTRTRRRTRAAAEAMGLTRSWISSVRRGGDLAICLATSVNLRRDGGRSPVGVVVGQRRYWGGIGGGRGIEWISSQEGKGRWRPWLWSPMGEREGRWREVAMAAI